MRKPRILPGLVLRARRAQYPCPDRDDETGLFGDTSDLARLIAAPAFLRRISESLPSVGKTAIPTLAVAYSST
jgi:hypothetical protein